MSDTNLPVVTPVEDEVKFEPEAPELPPDEPVTVIVDPIAHGEAAQRAANKMPHSERTVNGGKRA